MTVDERHRSAASLYGRHRGSAIWIAGSDPSLAEYPDTFFNDKVGITLHLAHLKFPASTYRYSSEYDRSEYLKSVDDGYRKKPIIASWPMYGRSRAATAALFADFDEVYYHRLFSNPPTGVRYQVDPAFTLEKLRRTAAGAARVWGAHGTCLHTAFYMAVLMGASEINLIGAGHGTYLPGVEHFGNAGSVDKEMRPTYPSFADPVNNVPVIEQTLALIDACKSEGIAVHWYRRYAQGNLEILTIDEEWLAEQKAIAEKNRKRPSPIRRIYRLLKNPICRIISAL